MEQKEFVKQCTLRGYCTKQEAAKWVKLHEQELYSEDDMIEAYRHASKYDTEEMRYLSSARGKTTAFRYGMEEDDTIATDWRY